jgi:predicted O-methyltransferase YrrM
MMIPRITIDSSDAKTELCFLGKATGTDKSPYNTSRHRHPYTAVYNMLFSPLKNKPIQFAEIGVAGGSSAMLWDLYFTHDDAKINMFDSDMNFLADAQGLVGDRFRFHQMDVSVDGDVARGLSSEQAGPYDVILDDSSHNHEHQIRIIKEAFPLVKQGGLLIVEDIFRATAEEDYSSLLGDVLAKCSAYYFVMCEHKDRWSPGWDNDKLLVLVKG